VNSTKLCPPGWSIPSSGTWSPLVTARGRHAEGRRAHEGGEDNALASSEHRCHERIGLLGPPRGCARPDRGIRVEGQFAIWWCSDEDPLTLPATAGFMHLSATDALARIGQSQLPFGYSVRCVR
jgi:uncharacterized protein (TIGR02145 family)